MMSLNQAQAQLDKATAVFQTVEKIEFIEYMMKKADSLAIEGENGLFVRYYHGCGNVFKMHMGKVDIFIPMLTEYLSIVAQVDKDTELVKELIRLKHYTDDLNEMLATNDPILRTVLNSSI